MNLRRIYPIVFLCLPLIAVGQNSDSLRLARIDTRLTELVGRDSTFAREVDVTSGRLPLSELLRNIARASGVNSTVQGVERNYRKP